MALEKGSERIDLVVAFVVPRVVLELSSVLATSLPSPTLTKVYVNASLNPMI